MEIIAKSNKKEIKITGEQKEINDFLGGIIPDFVKEGGVLFLIP